MAWLRLYDDILDDPKIQMLSDRAFRMLINLWCLAKRNGGRITGDVTLLSFSLRMPAGKIRDTLQALISANLIERDGDDYKPHDWDQHQYSGDVTAAERMRRYRARNGNRNDDRNTSRNSDVLEPESEPDTEQKVVERAVRAAPSKGTRWHPDQVVSNEWIADADIQRHDHDLPPIDLRLEATRFANYWASKSGGNATKTDWHRTWINWALDDSKRKIGKVSAHDKGTQGAALFLASLEGGDGTGHRGGAGAVGDPVPANGHGRPQVAGPVRDVLRGHARHVDRADQGRLPAVPEEPGESVLPVTGPIARSL